MITKEFVINIVNTIRSKNKIIVKKDDLDFHKLPLWVLENILDDSELNVTIVEIDNRYKIYK